MTIRIHGTQRVGQSPQAVFQFRDPLHDLRSGRLRPHVRVQFNLAFDLFKVLGDVGFTIICGMDAPRNNACQWIAIRHGTDYKS